MKNLLYISLFIWQLFLVGEALPPPNQQDQPITLCLYSPTLSIQNFKALKNGVNEVLNPMDITFQPFASSHDFESFISENRHYLAMMTGWHHEKLKAKHNMQIVRYGVLNEQTKDRFLLVYKKECDLTNIENLQLATSLDTDLAKRVIKQTELSQGETQPVILQVPKDIDALMSLTLNLFDIDMALISEEVLKSFSERYPNETKSLQKKYSTFSTPRMIIGISKDAPASVSAKLQVITKLKESKRGAELMQLLKLDNWIEPDQQLSEKKVGDENEK